MNIFKRLFKIGEAEANSALDKMEDPIKLTEQGIRDLKLDLDKNLEALARVKALAIRAKNDQEEFLDKKEDYHQKAVLILKKGQRGEMDAAEADRLAKEALVKRKKPSDTWSAPRLKPRNSMIMFRSSSRISSLSRPTSVTGKMNSEP